jgi:deoxycytidine triphosphate deaminase
VSTPEWEEEKRRGVAIAYKLALRSSGLLCGLVVHRLAMMDPGYGTVTIEHVPVWSNVELSTDATTAKRLLVVNTEQRLAVLVEELRALAQPTHAEREELR